MFWNRRHEGRIQWFRLESGKGEIVLNNGHVLPFRILAPQMDFEAGDRVTFEIRDHEVIRLHFLQRIMLSSDVFWCAHCKTHLRYHEVREIVHDGDWGAYNEWLCLTCGGKLERYGFGGAVLGRLIEQYEKGELQPEAAEFADAIRANEGRLITDFLERYLNVRK